MAFKATAYGGLVRPALNGLTTDFCSLNFRGRFGFDVELKSLVACSGMIRLAALKAFQKE